MTNKISNDDLFEATSVKSSISFSVDGLDLASGYKYESFITFLDTEAFLLDLLKNERAKVVLVTPEIAGLLENSGKLILVVDDPWRVYFTLQNYVAKNQTWQKTQIHPSAFIHPTAFVAQNGVDIGPGAVIEANAIIHTSSIIEQNAIIRSGAVIGTIGFEHKRTSKGILSVLHDGTTIIGEKTEIGSNTVIAQGYKRRSTVIGKDVRIDANSFLAHGVWVGDRTFIAAGVNIAGFTSIGSDCWIGLGALIKDQISIGNQAKVNIGSVVLRNVDEKASVLGNPARALPQ
jgi:UDP-3-O-[3-hydroxymyristoyl] glucosamine N-acyltransferase